jgi:hypothetical protein
MAFNVFDNIGIVSDRVLPLVSMLARNRNPQTSAMDFSKIDAEIIGGLKNERKRLMDAWKNRQWYEGNLEPFLEAMASELGLRRNTARSINIMATFAQVLTKYLYIGSPKRAVTDNDVLTEYLAETYSKSTFDQVMTQANRYAFVGDVCAVQVEINDADSEDEVEAMRALQKPAVGHRLWPADQFIVWTHPDYPTVPWAIATIDYYDNQRRLRVWTSDRFVTYTTTKYDPAAPWEGNAYKKVSEEKNPLGVIPFFFVWWRQPTTDFWSHGPGNTIQMFNENLVARLWKQNDDILFQRPILHVRNAVSDFKIPDKYQAGDMLRVAPVLNALGEGPEPTIEYAYCDLSYLQIDREQVDWDMKMFADSMGIPDSAWRLDGASASSGVQVISEQLPVIEESERRQKQLERYERDAAIVTLVVANEYLGDVPQLTAAINAGFDVSVNWGKMTKNRPGQESDQHAQFLLLNNLESEAGVIAMMDGITLDQAREKLAVIQQDRTAEAQANKVVTDISQPPGQMGGGLGDDTQAQEGA